IYRLSVGGWGFTRQIVVRPFLNDADRAGIVMVVAFFCATNTTRHFICYGAFTDQVYQLVVERIQSRRPHRLLRLRATLARLVAANVLAAAVVLGSFEDGGEAVLDIGDAVAELPRPRLVVLLLRRAHEGCDGGSQLLHLRQLRRL